MKSLSLFPSDDRCSILDQHTQPAQSVGLSVELVGLVGSSHSMGRAGKVGPSTFGFESTP